jgi:hypothetical protein
LPIFIHLQLIAFLLQCEWFKFFVEKLAQIPLEVNRSYEFVKRLTVSLVLACKRARIWLI